MVSLRRRRLRSPNASDGTGARVRDPTKVRNTYDLSDNVRSLEVSFPAHESKEPTARLSEDFVTPACPVPETARRTPLDQIEARVMSMSSILMRSSKGKNSHASGESGMEGRKRFSKNRAEGRVSMSNINDHGLGGRGSLKALQDRIEEEHGAQEGRRRCALMASPHRKMPWHCPLMAMEGHKLCQHHFERAEVTRSKARKGKMKAKRIWSNRKEMNHY